MCSCVRESASRTSRSVYTRKVVVVVIDDTAQTKCSACACEAWRYASLADSRVLEHSRRARGNTSVVVVKVRRTTGRAIVRKPRTSSAIVRAGITAQRSSISKCSRGTQRGNNACKIRVEVG